jgi:type I restriction enzyme M protein
MTPNYKAQTLTMIDSLKTICANYGLGNDGNEFKIISQVFLYKYLNDKYAYTVKQLDERLANNPQWEKVLADMSEDEREMLNMMVVDTAKLEPHHLISYLYTRQNDDDFAKLFDDTLIDIAVKNADIYSVQTNSGAKVVLFDRLSQFITHIGLFR